MKTLWMMATGENSPFGGRMARGAAFTGAQVKATKARAAYAVKEHPLKNATGTRVARRNQSPVPPAPSYSAAKT